MDWGTGQKSAKPARAAFTLIELLVIIAVLGVMTTVGVVSLRSGEGAARLKGSARDLYAAVRHARSIALVSQQPVVLTYSVENCDDEPVARVELASAKMSEDEDLLFPKIDDSVMRGMRLEVVKEGDVASDPAGRGRKPNISIFSNVGYLLGRFEASRKSAPTASAEDAATPDANAGGATAAVAQDPVSVVFETNGCVEPHRVWVYRDGRRRESGLLVSVDRFGGVKVTNGEWTP